MTAFALAFAACLAAGWIIIRTMPAIPNFDRDFGRYLLGAAMMFIGGGGLIVVGALALLRSVLP